MAEKIGPIFNRILIKKLDQALDNGSISKKDYNDLKKKYFGKPKLIQMDLFDPKKKKQGGLMAPKKTKKGLKVTVNLPATEKKKKGPAGGPKPKKKTKGISDLLKKPGQQGIPQTPLSTFKKKKKQKLTEEQKKNVEKGATVMEKEDIPGTPHFRMVPKKSGSGTIIMEAKKGGLMEATKRLKAQGLKKGGFPDLSGDGKVTMKDILMGRGVIKKPKKKASGGAVDTPRKKRGNYGPNIGKPFKAMGPVGGVPVNRSGTKIMSKAGRLAKRGYGIAKK